MHIAAKTGNIDMLKVFLEEGWPIDIPNEYGKGSPLGEAAREGQLDAIEYLISVGADIDNGIGKFATPLGNAAHRGHIEAVKWLVDHGATIDSTYDLMGTEMSPIALARDGKHDKVLEYLEQLSGSKSDTLDVKVLRSMPEAMEERVGSAVRSLYDEYSDTDLIFYENGETSGFYTAGLSRVLFQRDQGDDTLYGYEVITSWPIHPGQDLHRAGDEEVDWLLSWCRAVLGWIIVHDVPMGHQYLLPIDDEFIGRPAGIGFAYVSLIEKEVLHDVHERAETRLVRLVPLYESEAEYARNGHWDDLLHKLDEVNAVEEYQPKRASVI